MTDHDREAFVEALDRHDRGMSETEYQQFKERGIKEIVSAFRLQKMRRRMRKIVAPVFWLGTVCAVVGRVAASSASQDPRWVARATLCGTCGVFLASGRILGVSLKFTKTSVNDAQDHPGGGRPPQPSSGKKAADRHRGKGNTKKQKGQSQDRQPNLPERLCRQNPGKSSPCGRCFAGKSREG